MAIFGSFLDSDGKLKTQLMSMSPLKDREVDEKDPFGYSRECTRFGAKEHAQHIRGEMKEKFDKGMKSIVCLVGDHVSTNVKLAKMLDKALVGCRAHRHGLEMNRLVKNN